MCDECCFSWGVYKGKFDCYEDRGLCGQCALNDGMTLEEMVALSE